VQLQNVTKTTGAYTTTVAAGSNGVDISTWVGAGVLNVASTNQIPDGPGVISVVSSNGTYSCTYTGNNVSVSSFRAAGNQFTGLTALGSPPSSSLLSTGGAVALLNIGTFAYSGTLDTGSRVSIQSNGPSTAVSTASSIEQGLGPRIFDVGVATNAFRLKTNTVDQLNINTSSKQLQLPNAQQLVMYSDNYSTQTLNLNGSTGLVTGPLRGGKSVVFPGAAWAPGDHGLVTWNGDPVYAAANSVLPTAGQVHHVRVHCPTVFTATNLIIYVVTAGVTLTSGQCFAGLYSSAGALIASTADLSSGATSFATGGSYTFPLASGPFTNQAAGDYTIAMFFNGTTGPSIARFGNVAANLPNVALASPSLRHFIDSTNTGRTTTLPATIGTQTTNGIAFFAGIS
jgi:hypothetical protein